MARRARRPTERRAPAAPWPAALLADWGQALFIHFRLPPAALRPSVPYELDLLDGDAYVSLVAFTQSRLRPARGGRLAARLATPLACHPFLNVRTYVRDPINGRPAIYFLAEWIPNPLAALLGPALYGLPYRLGRLAYEQQTSAGNDQVLHGSIRAGPRELRYRATVCGAAPARPADPGSRDAFLLERYAALTSRGPARVRFDVDHAPWPQAAADVSLLSRTLLDAAGPWAAALRPCGANYSPGVRDVRIGWPTRLPGARRR